MLNCIPKNLQTGILALHDELDERIIEALANEFCGKRVTRSSNGTDKIASLDDAGEFRIDAIEGYGKNQYNEISALTVGIVGTGKRTGTYLSNVQLWDEL